MRERKGRWRSDDSSGTGRDTGGVVSRQEATEAVREFLIAHGRGQSDTPMS
jgi:hypothetical protein